MKRSAFGKSPHSHHTVQVSLRVYTAQKADDSCAHSMQQGILSNENEQRNISSPPVYTRDTLHIILHMHGVKLHRLLFYNVPLCFRPIESMTGIE